MDHNFVERRRREKNNKHFDSLMKFLKQKNDNHGKTRVDVLEYVIMFLEKGKFHIEIK